MRILLLLLALNLPQCSAKEDPDLYVSDEAAEWEPVGARDMKCHMILGTKGEKTLFKFWRCYNRETVCIKEVQQTTGEAAFSCTVRKGRYD